jgi:hypothetical protein
VKTSVWRKSRYFYSKKASLQNREAFFDSKQTDLVKVLAKFTPKIVRMADANRKEGRED